MPRRTPSRAPRPLRRRRATGCFAGAGRRGRRPAATASMLASSASRSAHSPSTRSLVLAPNDSANGERHASPRLGVHPSCPEPPVGEQTAKEAARQPGRIRKRATGGGNSPALSPAARAARRKSSQLPSPGRRGDVLHPHVCLLVVIDDPIGARRAQRRGQRCRQRGAVEHRLAPPVAPTRRIQALTEWRPREHLQHARPLDLATFAAHTTDDTVQAARRVDDADVGDRDRRPDDQLGRGIARHAPSDVCHLGVDPQASRSSHDHPHNSLRPGRHAARRRDDSTPPLSEPPALARGGRQCARRCDALSS